MSTTESRPWRYIGLRMPGELGAVGAPDPGELPAQWFELRVGQDELPELSTLGQPPSQRSGNENLEYGRFIYVQDQDGTLRPLEMSCTADPNELHDTFGRHEWGYGGHGPGCSAFSIALDATELSREEILAVLHLLDPLEQFMADLDRDQEWMLLASEVPPLFVRPASG